MQKFLIEDSSFLAALLNPKDSSHIAALKLFQSINNYDLTYVYSEIVISETSFVLMRSGIEPAVIRETVNKLSMIPKVIIHNLDSLSILRYTSRFYNNLVISKNLHNITKTNDFLIACLAKDLEGIIISSDKQMLRTLKSTGIKCYDFTDKEQILTLESYLKA